jgi:hypothetical protein
MVNVLESLAETVKWFGVQHLFDRMVLPSIPSLSAPSSDERSLPGREGFVGGQDGGRQCVYLLFRRDDLDRQLQLPSKHSGFGGAERSLTDCFDETTSTGSFSCSSPPHDLYRQLQLLLTSTFDETIWTGSFSCSSPVQSMCDSRKKEMFPSARSCRGEGLTVIFQFDTCVA